MKKYKFKNRSQKKSQSCVHLSYRHDTVVSKMLYTTVGYNDFDLIDKVEPPRPKKDAKSKGILRHIYRIVFLFVELYRPRLAYKVII